MRALRRWLRRLAGVVRRPRGARELDEELASHLQLHVDDNLRRGMTPEEARRQALVALGGLTQATEAYTIRAGCRSSTS